MNPPFTLEREQPWHRRRVTHVHDQWFHNLSDLNALTSAWLNELKMDRISQSISRGVFGEITSDLWMLKMLDTASDLARDVNSFVDDTSPEDSLLRMENAVWTVQALTLIRIKEKSPSLNLPDIHTLLEQISWQQGRSCAENRWSSSDSLTFEDLRFVLEALRDSPMGGYPHTDAFLIRRAIAQEVVLEMRVCPHHCSCTEAQTVADDLCRYHHHWMRGFVYALNTKIKFEYIPGGTRCRQRWSIIS